MSDDRSFFVELGNLLQAKINARKRLLAMPPAEAQRLADKTLYPEYWEYNPQDHDWDESIPTHFGEDFA